MKNMIEWQNKYNTKEGIEMLVKTLEGLNELKDERRRVGDGKLLDQPLKKFVIHKTWVADDCGNMHRIMDPIRIKFPSIPDVLEWHEFWDIISQKSIGLSGVCLENADHIPPSNMRCAVCGERFTIDTCFDVVDYHKWINIPLVDFVGWTLGNVEKCFEERSDARCYLQPYTGNESLIRNDKHIDLRPNPEYKSLKINEEGWRSAKDGITPSYIIEPGDEAFLNVVRYKHYKCHCSKRDKDQEISFRNIFKEAGIEILHLKAIPNEYCRCVLCAPWFLVTTPIGTIKIGWRKRVINIDWSQAKLNVGNMFDKEDVTKWNDGIHAWSKEKAIEYLSKIGEMFTKKVKV